MQTQLKTAAPLFSVLGEQTALVNCCGPERIQYHVGIAELQNPTAGRAILRLACTCDAGGGEARFFTWLSLVGGTQF